MEWRDLFNELNKKEYFQNLINFLNIEYNKKVIYPKKEDLFKCFRLTKFNDVKVIIIGQDPYHEENQANGLCFSVNKGVSLPPSLVNIYKEIKNEFGFINKSDGDLTYLARQGVLLLNKYLTVEKSKPLSHKIDLYDKLFVDIINFIETYNQNKIVYMLWGNEAKNFYFTYLDEFVQVGHYCGIKHTEPRKGACSKIFTHGDAYSVILNNGIGLTIRADPSDSQMEIQLDVNGVKGPNRAGRDAFIYRINKQEGLIPVRDDLYGMKPCTRTLSNPNGFENWIGWGCAYVIMQNGWEIKDDYPWGDL